MAFFDQLGQKLTQTSQDAVKKTKDMAEAVRLNSAVADEGKKIEAAYREIGRLYYERFADACDPALQAPVEEVRRAEAAIREMKDAIFRLKGVQICPACGAELPAGGAFCNSCGAKMEDDEIIVDAVTKDAPEEEIKEEIEVEIKAEVKETAEEARED